MASQGKVVGGVVVLGGVVLGRVRPVGVGVDGD